MGAAASSARRAVRNWNATNRAIRHLDREAKAREKAARSLKLTYNQNEADPIIHAKNDSLENRVHQFDIKSEGIKKNILPEGFDYVPKSTRKLPQRFEVGNPIPDPRIEFGFAIPDVIPKGKITMKQAIEMIKCFQLNTKTVSQLAEEYQLEPQVVENVCKYFALFECESARVWIPASKSKEEKVLLDEPIYQEDERIPEEGVSRFIRLHELEPPVKT